MSKDDYARAIIGEGKKRGITPRGIKIALATALVESNMLMYANSKDPASLNFPHDAVGSDGMSVGLFQQQNFAEWGSLECRMSAACSAGTFYDHLVKVNFGTAKAPIGYDDSRRSPGQSAQAVQRSAFPTRYDERFGEASSLFDRLVGSVVSNRPDFNEINQIGWDSANPHGSNRSQPPRNWLLHTQEGDGNAETLADFLRSTSGNGAVSYHYTGAEDPNDHGVTVCDVIDTDLYSWSVLNANVFTINFCFAGSRAAWTRDQWLAKCRNVIRVAAYLAVQDAKKYPTISTNVIKPPYASKGSGISDHRWVTRALGIGTHTDVGDGFPWDVLEADVKFFVGVPTSATPSAPPPAVDTTPIYRYPTVDEMTKQVWEQLFGFQAKGFEDLFGKTPDGSRGKFTVEAIADIHKKDFT